MKHVRIGLLFLLTVLLVCFALGAQADNAVPEGAIEVEEGLWHYAGESGAKLGVNHTKYPEVTSFTIEEDGKTLKPGDTVHFRIKFTAYDGAKIDWQYMYFGRSSRYNRHVDLQLNEETGEYVGEYTFLESDRGGEWYVTSLQVEDSYDFSTYYSSNSKRVMKRLLPGSVILQNDMGSETGAISNIVFEEKGKTLQPGDTIHVSFDLPKNLDLNYVDVDFSNRTGGNGIYLYYYMNNRYRDNPGNFTYDPATGHVTTDYVIETTRYNGTYRMSGIYAYDKDNTRYYISMSSRNLEFVLTGATPYEEKTLTIDSITCPENGKTLKDGDTVHVSFKVTSAQELKTVRAELELFDPDDYVYGSGVNNWISYELEADAELDPDTGLYTAAYTLQDTDLYGVYTVTVYAYNGDQSKTKSSDNMFRFAKTTEETFKRVDPATDLRWSDDGKALWKLPADHQGRMEVGLYKENGDRVTGIGWSSIRSDMSWTNTEGEALLSVPEEDLESGKYYFTVVMEGDGINYFDSVTAKSGLFTYTQPTVRVQKADEVVWVDHEDGYGGKAVRVHVPGDLTNISYVECKWFFAEKETDEPIECSWWSGTWTENEDRSYRYCDLFDNILQEYGAGYYSCQAKVYSKDVMVALHSEWSELSKGQYFGEAEDKVIDKLEDVVTTGKTPDEIRDQVQEISTQDLREALLTNEDVADSLRNLEVAAGATTQVTATAAAPAEIASGVSAVGAGLNDVTGAPTLVIDRPKQEDVLPAQFNNALAVRFSMELENVSDPDNLKVPVLIDMPVPESINPAYLVLLHYHLTTNEPEYIWPYVYQAGNKWYAQFVLTRFSDFIMAQSPTEKPDEETQKITDFVTRCYSLILDREPDATGLADWVDQLKKGTKTAAEIIYGFMYSPEYTNRNLGNEKTVEILYKTMLNREPDAGGKADWLNRLANGAEIKDIINGFCGSPEFLKLCESYGIVAGAVTPPLPENSEQIQAFVSRCYKLILNRNPDALGFADWVIQLANKTKNASEIIYGFMYSAEYTARGLSNAETVEILYNTMLNRASDEAGKNDWLNRLASGQQIVDIINGFCGSPEFNTLCAEYGIEPGRVATGGVKVVKTAAAQPAANEPAAEPVKNNGYLAFVNRCYQIALGREASEAELNGWAAQETNLKQAAKAILFSDEAQAKLAANEEFVKVLYRLYFNREADAEGFAYWTEKLNAGESREAVANVFEASDEFKTVLKGLKSK